MGAKIKTKGSRFPWDIVLIVYVPVFLWICIAIAKVLLNLPDNVAAALSLTVLAILLPFLLPIAAWSYEVEEDALRVEEDEQKV